LCGDTGGLDKQQTNASGSGPGLIGVRLARCLWRPTVQTALDQARATIRRLPQVRSS